jgi:hypothetical protein
MRGACAALVVLAALLAGGAAAGIAPRVTIFALPTVHERAQVVTLTGFAEGAKARDLVTIEAKQCGATAFRPAFQAHTDMRGGWSLPISPTITTTLRAVWKGARSTPVTVQDRPWVQLSLGTRTGRGFGFEVAVRSERQFWKRHVVVQRLDRLVGQWRDMKRVVLTSTGAAPGSPFVWSSARFSTNVPQGTRVRAVFPRSQAGPCYLEGYSNQLPAQ